MVVNAAGVDGIGMRAVVENGGWYIGGADGAAAGTRIEAKLITASGFEGSRELRGALGGGGGIDSIAADGGGAERGAIDEACGGSGGGMLGIDTRGATGGGAVDAAGAFGAIGALGAMGDFAAAGRKRDGATRTAGSAVGALPDGLFPDFIPASFAIRKFQGCTIHSMIRASPDHGRGRAFPEAP